MGKRDFDQWLSQFRESIADYEYYIDFQKVVENAKQLKVELSMMNSLIGAADIKKEFIELVNKYPNVLRCIPLLIAVREKEIHAMDEEGAFTYRFDKPNQTVDQYAKFMDKTGLFDLISRHLINNIYDYVLGVEAGLDSNARKNRGGHLMEDLVERYIRDTGLPYRKEVYLKDIERIFGLDLSSISNDGKASKRFDFVIKCEGCVYAMEVNFYSSGGSKLNETARSYKMLAEESKGIERFKFIWITDGRGWMSARGNLRETFDVLDDLYCIEELEEGILKELFNPDLVNNNNMGGRWNEDS